jgi:hypothetical protein
LLLAGTVRPSKAAFKFVGDAAAAGSGVSAGLYVAGGFIGFVAVLCLYDLGLKIQGLKNWDGTPKTVVHRRRR